MGGTPIVFPERTADAKKAPTTIDGTIATMKRASKSPSVASSIRVLRDSPGGLNSWLVKGGLSPFRFLYHRYRYKSANTQNSGARMMAADSKIVVIIK